MQELNSEQLYARSIVYHALAEALYEPVAEVQRSLTEAAIRAAQILGSPACQKAALALASLSAAPPAELRQRYRQVTHSRPGRPLALYESLHREGRLMGQATRMAERCYQKAGIVSASGELADHASMELAFLGHLAAAEAQAAAVDDRVLTARLRMEERAFLRLHPGAWLPAVGIDLAQSDDPFYTAVGSLLHEFLSEELDSGWSRQEKLANFPVIKDASQCTLCGFCVGACQTKALRVVEDENETALTLDNTRCIGCNRCIRDCPQNILEASLAETPGHTVSADSPGPQILRRSPRAHCPICDSPTVSQSELDAVFSTLEPDPTMQRQMSLCVGCKSLWNS